MSLAIFYQLLLVAAVPVVVSLFFILLSTTSVKRRMSEAVWQIIVGLAFAGVAIFGTHFGVDIEFATVNARDAAPLCAGLLFGAPAGIIAGVIGGAERLIAGLNGTGTYTMYACSISTALAGILAAFLRTKLFSNKAPSVLLAFLTGLVVETFHLMMVFVLKMKDPYTAFEVVRICSFPMIIANALGIGIATILVKMVINEKNKERNKEIPSISSRVQNVMLITVVVAFLITTAFIVVFQSQMSYTYANSILEGAVEDIGNEIQETADSDLLAVSRFIAADLKENPEADLSALCNKYDVEEINIINENGIIIASSKPDYVGFDMSSGDQAAEFLCLLSGEKEYVQEYQQITKISGVNEKYAGISLEKGFVQVGYDKAKFKKKIQTLVPLLTRNRKIGETGFVIISDDNGTIVSDRTKCSGHSVLWKLGINVDELKRLGKTTLTILDTECYAQYGEKEGYSIIALYPTEEANTDRNIGLFTNSFLEILVFALLFIVFFLLINKMVVRKIQVVNRKLDRISTGNLDVKLNDNSSREFASLSEDINKTVDTLKQYIKDAEERIDNELQVARHIQESSLPNANLVAGKDPRVDLFASMNTAKEVGGDFYDCYMLDDDKLAFMVADVSGKGIPASLFMMSAKTMLKNHIESGMSLDEAMTKANKKLCENNDTNMFLTAWVGVLDLTTGHMEYANAGHNKPVVARKDGPCEYLDTIPGFILAGMDTVRYRKKEMDLNPGDILYLYTDGVTEATDKDGGLYGDDRLLEVISKLPKKTSMGHTCELVQESVDKFVGEAPQFDDITMVAVRYLGNLKENKIETAEIERDAKISKIPEITAFVEEILEGHDCPMKSQMMISTALDELISNIANYGYKDKTGKVLVKTEWNENKRRFAITFVDSAIPYNPLKKEDANTKLKLEDRKIGGLGILIVKRTMDNMEYEYRDGHNILRIEKYI